MNKPMSQPTTTEGKRLFNEVHDYLDKHGEFPENKMCKKCRKNRAVGKPVSRSGLCNRCIGENQTKREEENNRYYEKRRKVTARDRVGLAAQDPGIFALPSIDD